VFGEGVRRNPPHVLERARALQDEFRHRGADAAAFEPWEGVVGHLDPALYRRAFQTAYADHLLGLGHRRIGHLAAAVEAWTFQRRAVSLAEAVARTPGASLVTRDAPISIETGRETAHAMLSAPDRPTALVCDYDILAVGAYKAAKALGLSVPGDVSITGFDDIPLAEALEPELTTVRLPAEELGSQAMSALLELMQNRSPGSPLLPADLIVRKSTAPPARNSTNGSAGPEGSMAQGSNR
jgi:DNA-binding LacI/PurR family transcriptional regulator